MQVLIERGTRPSGHRHEMECIHCHKKKIIKAWDTFTCQECARIFRYQRDRNKRTLPYYLKPDMEDGFVNIHKHRTADIHHSLPW